MSGASDCVVEGQMRKFQFFFERDGNVLWGNSVEQKNASRIDLETKEGDDYI